MSSLRAIQFDLFEHVTNVYACDSSGAVSNDNLYRFVARKMGLSDDDMNLKSPVGVGAEKHSLTKRAVRWHQQTLKSLGLLERVSRGVWQLTSKGKSQLTKIHSDFAVMAFSTDLGIAILGSNTKVFGRLNEPITLCVTSPPYMLKRERNYGNLHNEQDYIDFVCKSFDGVVKNLVPGGSIVLNVSNDIFEDGSPARSMYCEELLIALRNRFGLHLMDRLVWESNKPPGPIQWASKQRVQMNVSYEHLFWMTNDPFKVRSDNRRVLQPHTDSHKKLMRAGGDKRNASYSDGAYTLRAGKSFASETAGRIPRNILKIPNTCADKRGLIKIANEMGMPIHGATMPLALPKFLIQFLTSDSEEELVVDQFGGWLRTAKAAQELGRRWVTCDNVYEYLRVGAEGFRNYDGFCSRLSSLGGGMQGLRNFQAS